MTSKAEEQGVRTDSQGMDSRDRVGPKNSKDSKWRRRGLVWAGLLTLLLGLMLLDRSFAFWRNDSRNFPNANGVYTTTVDPDAPHGPLLGHVVLKMMAFSGLGLLVLSVVLFGSRDDAPRTRS